MMKTFNITALLTCHLATILLVNGACRASVENMPSGLMCELMAHPERTVITDPQPDFSWIVNSPENDEIQTAYHILVASTADKLAANTGDLWDSGRVESSQSVAVEYKGAPLYAGKSYWWKVRTFVKSDSPAQWSEPQQFHMQGQDNENSTVKDALPDRYLPVREERKPVKFLKVADGHAYYDFGTVTLNINSPIARALIGKEEGDAVEVQAPGGLRHYEVVSVSYL